jgi:ABC-2 type transport system permease protein
VVFGFAVNTDVQRVPMVLVDRDPGPASRALVDRFTRSGWFELVGVPGSLAELDEWLVSGGAQAALVIDADYDEALASGETSRVQLLIDGSDASSATVALGYAAGIVGELTRERATAALGERGGAPGGIELRPRVLYNPDLRSRWFYVPAVLAMILMIMTMLLTAMGVVREKEIGTLEQVMVTPIRPWQLIVGKLAPFAAIGVLQVFVVTAVTVFGFGVPLRGSFLLLLGLTALFLLNTLGLGLLVSTLVSNQQQAMMAAAFMLMVPMIYLSGLIFPIENMPPLIQEATRIIPLRYYNHVNRGIFLKGSGLGVLWPEALVLLGMGVSNLGVASLRFRKRLD